VVELAVGQNVVGLEIAMAAVPPPPPTPTTTAPPVLRRISGTVRDATTGAALANVRVTITGASGSRVVFTLQGGTYALDGLTPGLYNVFFELTNYVSEAIQVDMTNSDGPNSNVTLRPVPPPPPLG
jgi:hypothetical protein